MPPLLTLKTLSQDSRASPLCLAGATRYSPTQSGSPRRGSGALLCPGLWRSE